MILDLLYLYLTQHKPKNRNILEKDLVNKSKVQFNKTKNDSKGDQNYGI